MSLHDYRDSQALGYYSFYSLIMAAMRKADTYNLDLLKAAFPDTWKELKQRYNAPGGRLPPEVKADQLSMDLEASR